MNPEGAIQRPDQSLLEERSQVTFKTKDGYIALVPLFRVNPLKRLCQALEIRDLTEDPRFNTAEKMKRIGRS